MNLFTFTVFSTGLALAVALWLMVLKKVDR